MEPEHIAAVRLARSRLGRYYYEVEGNPAGYRVVFHGKTWFISRARRRLVEGIEFMLTVFDREEDILDP